MKKNYAKRFFIFGIIILTIFTIFTITLTSCSSSNKVKPLNQNAKNYEISGENGSYMFYSFGKNFFNDNQNALRPQLLTQPASPKRSRTAKICAGLYFGFSLISPVSSSKIAGEFIITCLKFLSSLGIIPSPIESISMPCILKK